MLRLESSERDDHATPPPIPSRSPPPAGKWNQAQEHGDHSAGIGAVAPTHVKGTPEGAHGAFAGDKSAASITPSRLASPVPGSNLGAGMALPNRMSFWANW